MSARECDRVRERLWPLDAPRAVVEGEEEALAHLEACPACQEWFRRDAAIGRLLREVRIEQAAGRELRERVFDALARERAMRPPERREATSRRGRSRAARLVGAVAVVGMTVLGLFVLTLDGDGSSAFAQDYLSRAVEERQVARADDADVTALFLTEFGQWIEPVQPENARLIRAMICLIEGRRAATVEYEIAGRTVAHYRIPLQSAGGRRVRGIRAESDGGVHAVRWSDERFEHALVSDLAPGALMDLARSGFGAP